MDNLTYRFVFMNGQIPKSIYTQKVGTELARYYRMGRAVLTQSGVHIHFGKETPDLEDTLHRLFGSIHTQFPDTALTLQFDSVVQHGLWTNPTQPEMEMYNRIHNALTEPLK